MEEAAEAVVVEAVPGDKGEYMARRAAVRSSAEGLNSRVYGH